MPEEPQMPHLWTKGVLAAAAFAAAGGVVVCVFQVPKDFSVWSMDAVSPGICSSIIALNNKVAPTAEQ
jgi:hypothetical protein